MLSSKNLEALTKAGYTYIVGSRLHKIPYDIAEYQKTQELIDNQIITTQLKGRQRIIYQYREKRAALDMHNIEYRTCISIKRFVNTVRPIRSGIVTINGKEYLAEPEISPDVIPLMRKLQTGH